MLDVFNYDEVSDDHSALGEDANQEDIDNFCTRCMVDYEYFAHSCLKIKTKTEGLQCI